jgi:uncharacterized membrane protein
MSNEQRIAQGLGAMSLGLGAVSVVAPDAVCRAIGIAPTADRTTLARVVGVREFGHAALLLGNRDPAPGAWSRVGGDLLDIGLMVIALGSPRVRRDRVTTVILGLVAITAIDVAASVVTSRASSNGNGSYSGNGTGRMPDQAHQTGRPVRQSITVDRSPDEAYAYWRKLEQLPTFMEHLESVESRPDGTSHWKAKAPLGTSVEWDAEIIEDQPGQRIAWRSIEGSGIKNGGSVEFRRAPKDQGTEVVVEMSYEPPAGQLGAVVAKLLGEEPDIQVSDDLRRFKQLLEVGEVVRSDATIVGRRGQRPAQPMETRQAVEARAETAITSGVTA